MSVETKIYEITYEIYNELVPEICKHVAEFKRIALILSNEDTLVLRAKLRMARWYILTLLNETRAKLIEARLLRDGNNCEQVDLGGHGTCCADADAKSLKEAQEAFLIAQVVASRMISEYASFLPPSRQDVLPLEGEIEVFKEGAVFADEYDSRKLTSYHQRYDVKFLLMTLIPGVIGFLWLMNMFGVWYWSV